MIALTLPEIKEFMSHLLLDTTFDHFSFIEGEIVTFNTFRIDGHIQKNFFDTEENVSDYSAWEQVRNFCFSLIRGKRTPLRFHFVFRLPANNTERLITQSRLPVRPEEVQGLYLNIRFDGSRLICITGTSFQTFSMDRTLEHTWDETVQKFFQSKNILFEVNE